MPYPKEDTVRFVSVMRIMKDKGIEELLEAARRIHEKHPETVFELLGAYEEETRARYEPMIEDLQSKGIVRYYGYRDDMPEFYQHCQAVIHPSYHEGMSNVLQEAAATARPVIASDINGCREIFENGVSGLAFLPQPMAVPSLLKKEIVQIPLKDEIPERQICLVYDSQHPMGAAARELKNTILLN